MNKDRLTLTLVIVTLAVSCAFGLVIYEEGDISDATVSDQVIPKHPAVSSIGDGNYKVAPLTIKISQSAIDESSNIVKNTAEWYAWSNDENPKLGDKITNLKGIVSTSGSKAITMDIDSTSNVGVYSITFTPTQYKGELTVFNVAFKLTSAAGNNVLSQQIYYKIVIESSTSVTIKNDAEGVASSFVLGKNESVQLKVSGGDPIVGTWYAQNLPKGLAMNSSGKISGVPAKVVTEQSVDIFITDFSGNVHKGTYTISVAGESTLKIKGHSDNIVYIGKDTLNKSNLDRYMMYTNTSGQFEIVCPDLKSLSAQIINASGEKEQKVMTPETSGNFVLKVNPTGTGDYTIILNGNDQGTDKTAMFAILVLDKINDVKADIYFDLKGA